MQATAACADTDSDLYQAIVDQAPDVIIFADCEGAIRVWNHSGTAPESTLGRLSQSG